MSESVVIGIAGGSGSGKTTVLKRVIQAFGTEQIALLDHDAYYIDLAHLPPSAREGTNFDHPDALDTTLMRTHLDQLLAGHPVHKPVYDFTAHTRTDRVVRVEPGPVVIVEGILVLYEALLRERMDIKIYVDAPDDVRLIRRIRRDLAERGRSLDSVLRQYEHAVRPMHLKFVEPAKRHADVIIPHGGHNQVAIDMVLARIEALLRTRSAEEA
ncbi:MAG: uridine kinase [Bacteroidota bacterium]